jgi:hypothetical protein
MFKKILAFALASLILLNIAILKETYAQADPSKDLEKWLLDNINILGLFMHRGAEYSKRGNYLEPTISFLVSDYNNKTSLYYPKTVSMTFSEYIDYVKNNKLVLQMNITYLGYEKTGPLTFVWPPFSYIYKRTFNDTTKLGWGTYLTSNIPLMSFVSNEAEPYTVNVFEWDARNVFVEKPEYLYEYLILGNQSNVKLPKGENILLALSPYKLDTSIYELIKTVLKGGTILYPNDPGKILDEFAKDDTSVGLLYITWEVEGDSGYLKPAAVSNYKHAVIQNITFMHYADGLMQEKGESKESWYNRTVQYDMDRIKKFNRDFKANYDIVNTPIFSTYGSPTKSYFTIVDLSNKDAASLFRATSVYYIIDPNVYNGKDKIKLKISDVKGKINLIYEINIEIDKERFNIKDINVINVDIKSDKYHVEYDVVDGKSSDVITIRSEKSYNEDGSLVLKLNFKIKGQIFASSSGEIFEYEYPIGNYQEFYSSSSQEMGTLNIYIGGWMPNPHPGTTSVFDFSSDGSGNEMSIKQKTSTYILKLFYHSYYVNVTDTISYGGVCEWKWTNQKSLIYQETTMMGNYYYYASTYSDWKYNLDGIMIIKDNKIIFKVTDEGSFQINILSYIAGATLTTKYRRIQSPELPSATCSGKSIFVYFIEERYPVYESSSRQKNEYYNYGWRLFFDKHEYYNLTEDQPVEIPESPSLLISLDTHQTVVEEELTGYIISYGKDAIGSTVSLNAYVEFNNTKVPITVTPNKLTISEGKYPSFTLKMPSYVSLRSKFGENMPLRLPVIIKAVDNRGANATEIVLLNAKGYFIVLNFKDVDLNLPDDPWKSNVLEKLGVLINTKPLKGVTLDISIREKNSMKEVYRDRVRDSRYVIVYDPNIFEKDKTYILNYTLNLDVLKLFKVEDAAINIKIPVQIPEDKNYANYTVYVPYSLFERYQKYTYALKGEDKKYRLLLADPKLVLELPIIGILSSISSLAPEDLKPFFSTLINSFDKLGFYIGPKIAFPAILSQEAKDTELEVFSEPFNFRDLNYRLYEDGFKDPSNYWSKLAKVIILQAELLRNYKYAESLTLIVSRIAALLITLAIFENRFIKDISGEKENKINLFQWFEKKFGGLNPNKLNTLNKLDSLKIGMLTGEGALLTILNLPFLKDSFFTPLIKPLKERVGQEGVSLIIASSFKIIRFLFDSLISKGKLFGDLAFEYVFQIIAFIVSHLLMLIHNLINQILVFLELGRLSLANLFLFLTNSLYQFNFIAQQLQDISYGNLRKNIMLPVEEPSWKKRGELYGVANLPLDYSGFEEGFYLIADGYLMVESITAMILSIVRGLDGIKFKIKNVERGKILESIFSLSKLFTGETLGINKGQGFSKKNIQGAYLAFVIAVLVDSIIKIIWNYIFYFLIIYSNVATELFAFMGVLLQMFLPLITAIFVGSKTAKNVGIKMNFQKALQLSDEDAKSLKSLSDKIRSSGLKLNDMITTFYYDSEFFNELTGYLRDANLLLTRSYYRITNATEQLKMQELRAAYDYEAAYLSLMLFAIVNSPSSRSLALETDYLSSKFTTIAEILNNASLLLNNATMNGHTIDKLGPLVILTPSDVFTNYYPATNNIDVVISNIGDKDANVKLKILETNMTGSFESNVVNLKARSTEIISLKPIKKAGESESVQATLLVYVDDQLIYELYINIPLTIETYSASNNEIEVYSDGPVSITDNGIRITNSTIVQISLPRGDSRYVALLDGRMIRSAEIYSNNYTILAIAFSKPVSGIITYKSIKQDVEYLEGKGSVKGETGVTIESSGAFKAQVSILHDNPYPEASLAGAEKYKIISIDLLSAEAGYVTIKISFEDLGISDPSQIHLYKYNATLEAYQEVKDYQVAINEKVVIFNLKPGDPVFALTYSKITGGISSGGTEIKQKSRLIIFDNNILLIIIILIIAPLILAILLYKKFKK